MSIEGTRSYGVGLARAVAAAGLMVIECEQPHRKTRRGKGKSDPIDAHLAVLTALRCDLQRLPTPRADGPLWGSPPRGPLARHANRADDGNNQHRGAASRPQIDRGGRAATTRRLTPHGTPPPIPHLVPGTAYQTTADGLTSKMYPIPPTARPVTGLGQSAFTPKGSLVRSQYPPPSETPPITTVLSMSLSASSAPRMRCLSSFATVVEIQRGEGRST